VTTPTPIASAVDLPDVDARINVEIVVDNLIAIQGLYFAAMLEQLKMFAVVDKLVEQFVRGQLPLGRGNAGKTLYNYWKKNPSRLTEIERRNLYMRTFGFSGGDSSAGTANAEFADLWIRFLSSVSIFARKLTIDDFFRSQEEIIRSGRDLARNLSLHGCGIAYFASIELQEQIREIIGLLSDDEIKTAYGARDMWEVIDRVASLEPGGAKNRAAYRAIATARAIIIKWLAANSEKLITQGQVAFLNVPALCNRPPATVDREPIASPTDCELVDACESWLAAAGTLDENGE
jgi:hypothetical protein